MTAASEGRKERRKQKPKRKRKANGADPLVRRSDLAEFVTKKDANTAFQQLSTNQENLGKTLNYNMQEIKVSFSMTDGWHHVFRRVLNDIVKGSTVVCEDGVDWDWYFREYTAVLAFAEAVSPLTKKLESDEDEGDKSDNQEEQTDDFVFGGDHGQDQAQHQAG